LYRLGICCCDCVITSKSLDPEYKATPLFQIFFSEKNLSYIRVNTVYVCILYVFYMYSICILYLSFLREVGGHRLPVGTNLAKDLPESTGELALEGLHFWKTAFSAMTCTSSVSHSQGPLGANGQRTEPEGNQKMVLMPCRTPPSLDSVRLWLEARRQYQCLLTLRGEASEPASPHRSRRSHLKLLGLSPPPASPADKRGPSQVGLQQVAGGGSPESPDLPPWQEPHQTPRPHQEQEEEEEEEEEHYQTPRPHQKPEEEEHYQTPRPHLEQEYRSELSTPLASCSVLLSLSPLPSRSKSSQTLHSTPIPRRLGEEPVGSTPLTDGKTLSLYIHDFLFCLN